MNVCADLHIHGRYSIGSSKNMGFGPLSLESEKKGVQLVATGDCLHSQWIKEIRELPEVDHGTFELNETRFILTTEVEDNRRVHHLLLFPSLSSAEDFRERIKTHSKNIDSDGRPNVALGGEEIAELAKDVDALIGPCHAFTPWTAMYAYHDSLGSCYGDMEEYISFIELGLSADTNLADRISELESLTFLTNSDAHSPNPAKIAREFNRFEMKDITFNELKMAILRTGGRRCVLNVGLPPQEGKYHESACIRCYNHYHLREAVMNKWKCTKCGGRIKKGVKDRVNEIATSDTPQHPPHRPDYLHLIPLGEIIMKAVGQKSTGTKTVTGIWSGLVEQLGDEVSVLVDSDMEDIAGLADERVVHAIRAFRSGAVIFHPGGGGRYGTVEIPDNIEEALAQQKRSQEKEARGQTALFEF